MPIMCSAGRSRAIASADASGAPAGIDLVDQAHHRVEIGLARATRHLRHRQAERQIVDAELEEAVAHGDKRAFPDDGTIQYTHRNVCFVVSASTGAGITAWRLHPAQCVCRHQPEDLERVRQHEAWQEYDYGVSASSHAEQVLSVGLMRAMAKQYADEDGSQHYNNNIYDIADYLCCEFSDSLSLPGLAQLHMLVCVCLF